MTAPESRDLDDLVSGYVACRNAWEGALGNASKANPLFDEAHRMAVQLRASDEGRAALLELLDHSSPAVRLGAATESTPYAPRLAEVTLRALADAGGRHSFSAEIVLKEFEAGRLRVDW